MKTTQLIDAIVLFVLSKENLTGLELGQRLSLLTPWKNWDKAKVVKDAYRATSRLRALGLIEECGGSGRAKPFRLTAIGRDDADEILEVFGGFH